MQLNLPQRWLNYIDKKYQGELSLEHFSNKKVLLEFEDGSRAIFNYAFYEINDDWKEICVFTEHCGYHCFSTNGLKYNLI